MNNERYLVHHGILGQKWGIRRYQNEDGSLTAAGKKRYDTGNTSSSTSNSSKKNSTKNYKKYAIVGAAVLGTGLAVYGGYKASKYIKSKAGSKSYKDGVEAIQKAFVTFDKMDEFASKYPASYNDMRSNLTALDKRTNAVGKSTIQAVKYLHNSKSYPLPIEKYL